MSNRPHEAGIAELVRPVLKRLNKVKERVPEKSDMEKIIDEISIEVVKTKEILDSRENFDKELAGYLGMIERQIIDPWIDHKPREKASNLPQETTITEAGESSTTHYQKDKEVISKAQKHMDSLNLSQSIHMWSLGMFPENTELKMRLVIYWWIVLFWEYPDSNYERIIYGLVEKKVLIPVHREHNNIIDRFTIEPKFHKLLISNNERCGYVSSEKREESTWRLYRKSVEASFDMLLNVDQRYLNSNDIMDISDKHNLEVVQLGSWGFTEAEVHNGVEETDSKSKEHIEVDQTDFLKKLGTGVHCLSLRGISRITELHESIGKQKYLKILDLRACHNLEKLPQKPKSTLIQKLIRWALPQENVWFNNLMILDISECYLLDYMPKWVCELSNLEVLKGFVVGSFENKHQSCHLGDLSNLYKLRKLSIRISVNTLGPDVFRGFNSLDRLLVLTIIWGQKKYGKEIPTYSLPKNLEKLDIRCYPEDDASKLQNPEELKHLKRLYVRGGNLTKIPCNDNWNVGNVEILRLRFMKKLAPTNWNEVRSSFKNLRYVEYVGCPRPENFPIDGNSWHNEE